MFSRFVMPFTERAAAKFRFGPFLFDASVPELLKHGIRVRLRGQPLRLLEVLLENQGRVVSREQLREAIWPGDVHVDFDPALNTTVKKLRQVLEDDPNEAVYIETLPRVGYRFIAQAERLGACAGPEAPDVETPPVIYRPSRAWILGLIALVVLGAIAALIRRSRNEKAPVASERTFITTFAGNQKNPALSPDGAQVAFAWEGSDLKNQDIYVTSMSGVGLRRLTTDPADDLAPAWSPDGSEIAFERIINDVRWIMIVSAAGGAERKIGECDGFFLAWTPDGTGVVFARRRPRERNFELWSVSAKTGEQQRITAPGEFVNGWQQFGYSPDGTTLGYTYWPDKISEAELYIRPASGGTPRRLTSLHSQLSWCWNPDGRSAIVSSEQEGVFRLSQLRTGDQHPLPLPVDGAGDDAQFPAAARIANGPAGTARLVFERATNEFNLYHYALLPSANGTSTVLGSPEPIARSTRVTSSPQISPDGKEDPIRIEPLWISRIVAGGRRWLQSPPANGIRIRASYPRIAAVVAGRYTNRVRCLRNAYATLYDFG